MTVGNGYFSVLGVKIEDEESLNAALEKIKTKYDAGYEERYAGVTDAKRENQIKRTKVRLEREKNEMAKLTENIDASKFNKCKWSEKVSRNKLIKLYQDDAKTVIPLLCFSLVSMIFMIFQIPILRLISDKHTLTSTVTTKKVMTFVT